MSQKLCCERMRIISEACQTEGYLQQLFRYYRVRHYNGKVEYGKSKFYYHQQSPSYVKSQLDSNELKSSEKPLNELRNNGFAETGQEGVLSTTERQTKHETSLKSSNNNVRGCPSPVGGRPAKSVVERPRGFKSHTPRFLGTLRVEWIRDLVFAEKRKQGSNHYPQDEVFQELLRTSRLPKVKIILTSLSLSSSRILGRLNQGKLNC